MWICRHFFGFSCRVHAEVPEVVLQPASEPNKREKLEGRCLEDLWFWVSLMCLPAAWGGRGRESFPLVWSQLQDDVLTDSSASWSHYRRSRDGNIERGSSPHRLISAGAAQPADMDSGTRRFLPFWQAAGVPCAARM